MVRGAGARKQGVPFGPFLALGGIVGAALRARDHRLVRAIWHQRLIGSRVQDLARALSPKGDRDRRR